MMLRQQQSSTNYNKINIKAENCLLHSKPVQKICISPQCHNYRGLCKKCQDEDFVHKLFHKSLQKAYEQTRQNIDDLFKGLKGLRVKIIQQMQSNINSYQGLYQVEMKLSEIKQIIDQKINNFKLQLRRLYQKRIKQKLHQLFSTVQKSQQFLQQQKVRLIKTHNLKPFYLNDLTHQLRFYQSYFQQILQKNIRKFKTGFDHDKILKMMVTFQQNLQTIFKSEIQLHPQERLHIFTGQNGNNRIYLLTQMKSINIQNIDIQKQEHYLKGVASSVYFKQKDCYYVFGQGSLQSNRVQKYSNGQLRLVGKLNTKRKNFSICLIGSQIFIVGGQNKQQGCLVHCQKYVPSESKVYIISSLNCKSSRHNLYNYKQRFILKIGGTEQVQSLQSSDRIPIQAPPQFYCLQTEEWRVIDMPLSSKNNMITFGLYPSFFSGEDNKIIILANSQNVRKQKIKYTLQIQIVDNSSLKQIRINQSDIQINKNLQIFKFNKRDPVNGKYLCLVKQEGDDSVIQLKELSL